MYVKRTMYIVHCSGKRFSNELHVDTALPWFMNQAERVKQLVSLYLLAYWKKNLIHFPYAKILTFYE